MELLYNARIGKNTFPNNLKTEHLNSHKLFLQLKIFLNVVVVGIHFSMYVV